MLPADIFDYRRKWLPGHEVQKHSDLRSYYFDWCKYNLEKHEWHLVKYTDVYGDTWHFEKEEDAKRFRDLVYV